MTGPDFQKLLRLWRLALRLGAIFLAIFVIHQLVLWLEDWTTATGNQNLMVGTLVLLLLAYATLMAIPFVPGIEIGVSLMILNGPSIAPVIYGATLLGLTSAYLVGRYLSYAQIHWLLDGLNLKSAGQLVDRLNALSREDRLTLLRARSPKFLAPVITDYRYVLIGVLLNVPGNAIVGGGGGIGLVAGISRLFSTPAMILTFAIAVSPVPIAVMIFGTSLLN